MKKFWLPMTILLASLLPAPLEISAADAPAATVAAQRNNGGNHRSSGDKKTENRGSNGRKTSGRGNEKSGNRPNNNNSGNKENNRRPNNNTGRPGNGNNKPNNGNNKPGNGNRPGNGNKPNNGNRPGNGNKPNNGNRPGNGNRPNNGNKPGNGFNPGHHGGGNSLPRPGHGSHTPPPPPPPPHRDYWHPLPPPPPRPVHFSHRLPPRPSFLGLALGTLFDISLRTLNTSGYNVVYAADNIMTLANVSQMGVIWPDVDLFYGPGGMNGARFQRLTPSIDLLSYNTAYAQLTSMYGAPESETRTRNSMSAVWWCGGNTYVTLTSGPANGIPGYATEMIFGQ